MKSYVVLHKRPSGDVSKPSSDAIIYSTNHFYQFVFPNYLYSPMAETVNHIEVAIHALSSQMEKRDRKNLDTLKTNYSTNLHARCKNERDKHG